MANCSPCVQTYEAYLSDVPSSWRKQIADLMCKVKSDVTSSVETCESVKACETVTTLSPFTFSEDILSISYTDERGVVITRDIDISSTTGSFIDNQFVSSQVAEFWINGRASVGNLDVTSSTLPTNGLYLSGTSEISVAASGTQITSINSAGLMKHNGNIFLSAAISSAPAISFFLGNFSDADYYVQRVGTDLIFHSAGLATIKVSGDLGYVLGSSLNVGHRWYNMDAVSNKVLMNLFPSGRLTLGGDLSPGDIFPSALLNMQSTTMGLLPPRMTTAQKNAIVSPINGLMVYDTDLDKLCVYTTIWETITSA